MDSFEWNKIIGAVLGTAIFIFVVRLVGEELYKPEQPAKPGYVVEGVVETPAGGGTAAPAEEALPDWGTVLAKADVAAGKFVLRGRVGKRGIWRHRIDLFKSVSVMCCRPEALSRSTTGKQPHP